MHATEDAPKSRSFQTTDQGAAFFGVGVAILLALAADLFHPVPIWLLLTGGAAGVVCFTLGLFWFEQLRRPTLVVGLCFVLVGFLFYVFLGDRLDNRSPETNRLNSKLQGAQTTNQARTPSRTDEAVRFPQQSSRPGSGATIGRPQAEIPDQVQASPPTPEIVAPPARSGAEANTTYSPSSTSSSDKNQVGSDWTPADDNTASVAHLGQATVSPRRKKIDMLDFSEHPTGTQ